MGMPVAAVIELAICQQWRAHAQLTLTNDTANCSYVCNGAGIRASAELCRQSC